MSIGSGASAVDYAYDVIYIYYIYYTVYTNTMMTDNWVISPSSSPRNAFSSLPANDLSAENRPIHVPTVHSSYNIPQMPTLSADGTTVDIVRDMRLQVTGGFPAIVRKAVYLHELAFACLFWYCGPPSS